MKRVSFPKKLKRGDFFIISIILLLSFFILIQSFQQKDFQQNTCIIMKNDVIIKKINLSQNQSQTIQIDGKYQNLLEIQDGSVRVKSSSCPNQVCVHSGWISKSGQMIACLPNQVLIRLSGETSEEVDIIAK